MPTFDWRSLLDAAPVIAGALAPDPLVGAAILQGHLSSMERMRQENLQRQQFERQQQLAQAQIAHLSAQNQHLTTQNEIAGQHAGIERGRLALENLKAFYNESAKAANFAEANAEDPLTAQNALTARLAGMASSFGLPPTATSGLLPNMTQAVSRKAKADAANLLEGHIKGIPDEQKGQPLTDASVAFTWHDQSVPLKQALLARGHIEGEPIKPSELRGLYGAAINPGTGGPWQPLAKSPAGTQTERAHALLGRIAEAKQSGDMATASALMADYQRLIQANQDLAVKNPEMDALTKELARGRLADLTDKRDRGPKLPQRESDVVVSIHQMTPLVDELLAKAEARVAAKPKAAAGIAGTLGAIPERLGRAATKAAYSAGLPVGTVDDERIQLAALLQVLGTVPYMRGMRNMRFVTQIQQHLVDPSSTDESMIERLTTLKRILPGMEQAVYDVENRGVIPHPHPLPTPEAGPTPGANPFRR